MKGAEKELYSLTQLYGNVFASDDSMKFPFSNVPLFKGENKDRVMTFLSDCPIIAYAPGEYIMRNGEYDENCCVLLVGKAKVELRDETATDREDKFIQEGDFFGEIAIFSGVPRTADIIASEDSAVMLIPKERMFDLMDSMPLVKTRIDTIYKERVLGNHLKKIQIFSKMNDSELEALKEKATIHTYKTGEVIFREGDEADAFYLILFGFVKVQQTTKKGISTLAYLKGEQHFGEVSLLSKKQKRIATVTTLSRTQLIRVAREDFLEFVKERKEFEEILIDLAKRREEESKKMAGDHHLADTIEATIETGIIQTRSVHLLDTTKCVQCGNCVESCAELHDGIPRLVRKGVRLNGFLLATTSCRHCNDPACMYQCPTGAITRDSFGEIFHKEICIGCGACVINCPYDSLTLVEDKPPPKPKFSERALSWVLGEEPKLKKWKRKMEKFGVSSSELGRLQKSGFKVVKCDMCEGYEMLGCVYNCPTSAMLLINPTEYFSDLIPD